MRKSRLQRIISFLLILFLLFSFYKIGVPVLILPVIGIIFLLLILLKGTFYKKIDKLITNKFAFIDRLPSWCKTLLTIFVFLLAYSILKQIIFVSLRLVGIDIQQIVKEAAK